MSYPDLTTSSFAAVSDPARLPKSSSTSAKQIDPQDPGTLAQSHASAVLAHTARETEPFRTPLGFFMPKDKLRAALDAPQGTERSYWQYSLYRGPDVCNPMVKVHYCKTKGQMETVSQLFLNKEVIGFDLEWKASASAKEGIKRNVSLIQMASEERVALFHIARFRGEEIDDLVAPTFRQIMESSAVAKAGVAIKGDCTRLKSYLGIDCRGQFELSHLYKLIRFHKGQAVQMNKYCVALGKQVQEYLQLPLLKGAVQTSDWWNRDLSMQQVKYAASDAYAGFQLFHHMEAARLAFDPVPPRPAYAELNRPLFPISAKVVEPPDDASESSEDPFESFATPTSDDGFDDLANDLTQMILDDDMISFASSVEKQQPPNAKDEATPNSPTLIKSKVPPSEELDQANEWVATYKAEHVGEAQLVPAHLRAYHLWHHQNLDVPAITATLRDPPLKVISIMDYICEAVWRAKLPADPARFAELGTLGINPVRAYHRTMFRAAAEEVEWRKNVDPSVIAEETNIGWWRRRSEPPGNKELQVS